MLCKDHTTATSVAEVMLDNGRRVMQFLRKGGTVPQFVSQEKVEPHRVYLALAWAKAVEKNPSMYMMADLENWTDHDIAESVCFDAPPSGGASCPPLRLYNPPPQDTLVERAKINGLAVVLVGGLCALAIAALGYAVIRAVFD